MQLSWTLQIFRAKPGKPRREGRRTQEPADTNAGKYNILPTFILSVFAGVFLQSLLYRLYLLWARRQHAFLQSIELIEAAPRAHLTQPHEDTPHRL